MPFTVGWYDTGMVIDCTDTLDAEATEKLLKVVVTALDGCVNRTNMILDWRGSQGDPELRQRCSQRIAALGHPKLGLVAAVDSNPSASVRIDRLHGGRPDPYLACASLEEAVLRLTAWAAPIR